jgi:hypothetical protein
MSYALVDTINILLIGVVVAAGVMLPAVEKGGRYGRVATLLILGDWLGVLVLALLSLLVFDGIGDAVGTFVDSPVFGILLILTGVFIAVMQRNRAAVARGAGYVGAVLLTLLGITHLL